MICLQPRYSASYFHPSEGKHGYAKPVSHHRKLSRPSLVELACVIVDYLPYMRLVGIGDVATKAERGQIRNAITVRRD